MDRPPMDTCRITAVICTYNRYDLLEGALESLLNQSIEPDRYKIVVADNSPDEAISKTKAEKYHDLEQVRWLYVATPGLSNARNVGLSECQSELLAYLDDDAVAAPEWLEGLIEAFDTFGERAVAAGGPIHPIWQEPRPEWMPDEYLGSLTLVDWRGPLRIADEQEWIAGANIAFRAEALREIGGFPTALGRIGGGAILLSNEENEVIAKLRARGGEVVWAPRAKVRHLVSRERLRPDWLRRRMAWQAASDFVSQGGAQGQNLEPYWQGVLDYFNRVPPRLRTPRGLFSETNDPEIYALQVGANYNMTMLLLAGCHLADRFAAVENGASSAGR